MITQIPCYLKESSIIHRATLSSLSKSSSLNEKQHGCQVCNTWLTMCSSFRKDHRSIKRPVLRSYRWADQDNACAVELPLLTIADGSVALLSISIKMHDWQNMCVCFIYVNEGAGTDEIVRMSRITLNGTRTRVRWSSTCTSDLRLRRVWTDD